MLKLLIPVILALLGVAGGAAVGIVMKPPLETKEGDEKGAKDKGKDAEEDMTYYDPHEDDPFASIERDEEGEPTSEYVEISRRFVVPLIERSASGRLKKSMIAINFTLEMEPGKTGLAVQHEPKIRDVLLRTLISFASTGAFDETANPHSTMKELRRELRKAARGVLGKSVRDVLIGELIKQKA
ncbi:MAG: flagellar basal body-associated FliL family protein [Pseudomonadota bacterium]